MTTQDAVLRHYQTEAPIQTLTLTRPRWLRSPIRYETDYYVEDVLDEMCTLVEAWMASKDDLELTMDIDSFSHEYKTVMFHGHESTATTPSEEYFDLTYLEETHTLFQQCQSLALHYDIGLTRTANDLHSFLRSVLTMYDPDASEDPDEPPLDATGWI
jgi:hypothetical protein